MVSAQYFAKPKLWKPLGYFIKINKNVLQDKKNQLRFNVCSANSTETQPDK